MSLRHSGPAVESVAVLVSSDSGKTSPGSIRIQRWDKQARTRRALKFWGGAWAIAICLVPIPILHFVLVPALLIAGPAGAWAISTQGSSILGGESACPECGVPLPLSAGADAWPLKDLCSACQSRVRVERA